MENNYYIAINYKFDAKVKGLWGEFTARSTVHAKYMSQESIDRAIAEIKKYIKEYNAEIELHIDSLDWYDKDMLVYRLHHETDGSITWISWPNKVNDKYGTGVAKTITTRQINTVVMETINTLNTLINKEDK